MRQEIVREQAVGAMGKHGLFTAEQIASRFGLSPATVDHYVRRGLLRPLQLNDGRYFNAGDFIRMEIIEKGQRMGLRLGEIKLLIDTAGKIR